MEFTIHLNPITKKNSSQIIQCRGRSMIIPSKQYKEYEKNCKIFMPNCEMIDYPVNIKCVYFMPTKRKVDITNLLSATDDILTKYGIISDDNRNIVAGHDGSRVYYNKNSPRTEITIDKIDDYEQWGAK
jgi:Holliday junction resolvase RusA-like endonuclease